METEAPDRWLRNLFTLVVIVAAVLYGGWYLIHRHSSAGDKAVAVKTQSGASSCSNSGYYIQNRLDGSKQTIYDCQFPRRMRCVGEEGGITSDITEEVRLVFSTTLGSGKPACIQ